MRTQRNDSEQGRERQRDYWRRWAQSPHGKAVIEAGRDRRAAIRTRNLMREYGIESIDRLVDLLTMNGGDK